jgi:hypothetical protein
MSLAIASRKLAKHRFGSCSSLPALKAGKRKTRFYLKSGWANPLNTRLEFGGDTVGLPKSPRFGDAATKEVK